MYSIFLKKNVFEHCSPYSTTIVNVIYHALEVDQFYSNILVMLISSDGHEIAVVYFRCGYDPDNYESDTVGIIIKTTSLV